MAAIQNDRDVLLQAASVRVVPVVIQIGDVDGLGDALKRIEITSSAPSFVGASGTPTPASITLTAHLKNGLSGAVTWAVVDGSASIAPSGLTCTVSGSSVTGTGVIIRASVLDNGTTHTAQIVLARYGALSAADTVSLTTQVTGQLASGNVSGLGALALLNTVNLNTQTVGALNLATQTSGKINANTQVTNLGNLAFANALAANQIGAGQLAAGVIYAGTVNATQVSAGSFSGREFTGGTFTGAQFRTATSSDRVQIDSFGGAAHMISIYKGSNRVVEISGAGVKSTITSVGGGTAEGAGMFYNYAGTGVFGQSLGTGGFSVYGYTAAINGVGVYGNSVRGYGAIFESSSGPAVRLIAVTALPTNKTAGGMCYHGTHGLCFSDGTNWIKLTGTVVT